jgi:hypothetical protein
MSRASRVAVRILRKGNKWLVQGRVTSVLCDTFDQAWEASVPYFAGRKR